MMEKEKDRIMMEKEKDIGHGMCIYRCWNIDCID